MLAEKTFPKVLMNPVPDFPLEIALMLRDVCGLNAFVETGTYRGGATRAAAPHFARVLTVEGVAARFEAGNALQWPANVERFCGDSGEMLGNMLKRLRQPAVVWLDAHWICCGSPTPEVDPLQVEAAACPLLAELGHLRYGNHAIMIDDAHYFLSPPRLRGAAEQWPSLDQICAALPGRYVVLHSGVLIAVANRYRAAVMAWCVRNADKGPRQ
jgi:hypothetical protein